MIFFSGENMTGGYGGADIITSCTISVNRGEIVAILGPNGAGKSTAMKAMLGLLNLKSGKVSIDGKDISKLTPQDRVKEGISFVPQTRNVFTGLSVLENLEMGAYLREERVEEIIDQVYRQITAYGFQEGKNKLIAGIVLTGGGSQLRHIKQLTEYITGMSTRIGYSNEHLAKGTSEEISNPSYATSVGLVLRGLKVNNLQDIKDTEVNTDVNNDNSFFETWSKRFLQYLSNDSI